MAESVTESANSPAPLPAAQFVQVSTTTDSRQEAGRIARSVVEQRLAACAQVTGAIVSTYWWEGAVDTADEVMVVMKTTVDRVPALVDQVVEMHSYDLPEVLVTPITGGNTEYLEWIAAETATPPGR